MSREIPFFELFAQLQLSPELRLKLLGAVIASACIHQDTLLGFPAHTLPFRCGEFTTLSTAYSFSISSINASTSRS